MINIIVGKGIITENVPKALLKKVEKDLTFDNPDYINAMKFGKFISADMPSHFHLFEIEGNNCWVPRGYIHPLLHWIKKKKLKVKIEDETLLLKPKDWKFLGTLRKDQKKAIPDLVNYPCGVLEGETGSGKTAICINMIVQRQQPTLVIVHSKELLYQWQSQIKKFMGYDCGLVGDGNYKVKDITVGIINSVRNKIDKLKDKFGHIIADEVHRVTTWAETIAEFRAKYYLGASATPYRNDGLGDAIFAIMGPHRHRIDSKELRDTGAVLVPDIYRLNSKFEYMFTNDYSTMITELVQDEARNSMIVSSISSDLKKFNENILVISDRVNHLKIMQEMLLKRYDINGSILTGKISTKKRKKIIEEVRAGLCQVLFASSSLISEGFDSPNLTALFSGTPVKFSGKLIQGIGRILRPDGDKKPRLYDIRDNNVPVLQYSGYHRDRIYRKKGW